MGDRLSRGLRSAAGLLTRVPVGSVRGEASGVAWFPVVGALVGLAAAGTYGLARLVLPPLVAASLAVTALILVTGALHEDGLADYADALGSQGRRALEIMGDSSIGVFGTIAVTLSVLIRVSAMSALDPAPALAALVAAHAMARSAAVALAALVPPARSEGLGCGLSRQVTPRATWVAGTGALVIALVVIGIWVVVAAALALGVVAYLSRSARKRLGGVTGDVLGACEQVVEVGLMVVAVIAVGADAPAWEGLLTPVS